MVALLIGYARVSTDQQDLTAKRDGLTSLGVAANRIYVDPGLTATNRKRPGLREAMAACREGDTLLVTNLDRPASEAVARRHRRRPHRAPGPSEPGRVGVRPHRPGRAVAVQRAGHGRRILCYLDTPRCSPPRCEGCCLMQ